MEKKYFDCYSELSIDDKRNVLLKEICDTLNILESVCQKRNIKYDKLKSSYYIKNRELLLEEDYYDLMFIYIIYIKEDIASLLS